MSKHTPGPWVVDSGMVFGSEDVGEPKICNCTGFEPLYGAHEQAANLRLIAAAPDLLGALTELRDALDSGVYEHPASTWERLARKVNAAIAKATGTAA